MHRSEARSKRVMRHNQHRIAENVDISQIFFFKITTVKKVEKTNEKYVHRVERDERRDNQLYTRHSFHDFSLAFFFVVLNERKMVSKFEKSEKK